MSPRGQMKRGRLTAITPAAAGACAAACSAANAPEHTPNATTGRRQCAPSQSVAAATSAIAGSEYSTSA
ncbi:Uncharacterised protein [Burkholderia pseudomallei]|nr:Uncharacterised protein [Burkholderia pseudomallei]CAJ4895875.1 Uncharacterised protein [Burkholderia pseudomallei]CAJ8429877.1 Uncharacterised protein [Burkholderia pseudomallei]CAK0155869.1 Uncharacterised protein [Burkholderia pseudomallei]